MTIALKTSVYYWMRSLMYRTPIARWHHRWRARRAAPAEYETVTFWNQELAGRMSMPNLNGRIGNAIRDLTTVQLVTACTPSVRRALDVGCGFGTLGRALEPYGCERYLGVDLSDFVIDRNRRDAADVAWPIDVEYRQADLRAFDASDEPPFNIIVFNEVMKYLSVDEAVRQLQRYATWLEPDGLLCMNLSDDPKCARIFEAAHRHLDWVYGLVYQQQPSAPSFRLTRNRATPPFAVGLFRPRAAA